MIARVAHEAGLTPERLQEAMKPAALTRRAPTWVFLGPPGVGKGTYASRVADALGIAHISAGDLVRKEMKEQSDLGRKVRLIFWPISQGVFAPCTLPSSLRIVLQRQLGAQFGGHQSVF